MKSAIDSKNNTAFLTGGRQGVGAEVVQAIASVNGNVIFTGTSKFPPKWLDTESKKI